MKTIDIDELENYGLPEYYELCETYNVVSTNYGHTDVDTEILKAIDRQLLEHGLEIILWENGEDSEWIIVPL